MPVDQDVTLPAETYRVLVRVPSIWWNEPEAVTEIAAALGRSVADVRRRLTYLRVIGLIERRLSRGIVPAIEVRRISKD